MIDFRKDYREPTPYQKETIDKIKDLAGELARTIQYGHDQKLQEGEPSGREQSLALTNLEQSVMWAVKNWTKDNSRPAPVKE
jgi:hypothetical protein